MSSNYWTTERLDKTGAHYRIAVGERSNGKTTSPLVNIIREYSTSGQRGTYIRQMDIDLRGQRGASIMRSLIYGGKNKDRNLIMENSGGKYDTVKYQSRAWYLGTTDPDTGDVEYEREPFCYAMALSQMKHDKSATPANVTQIFFDEFIPVDGQYLTDETVLFRNVISTIVRDSARAVIYMAANTTTWNSPYFRMFGIGRDLRDMDPGDIKVFDHKGKHRDSPTMRVALEYCKSSASEYGGKDSDVYFTMADEHSAMITDGTFAIPNYPTCPHHFTKDNVKVTYWIDAGYDEDTIFRSRLMLVDGDLFVFVDSVSMHLYEYLRDERRDIFYSLGFSAKRNHFISPVLPYDSKRANYLRDAIMTSRIFFATNEVGEDFMHYAISSRDHSIVTL